MKTWFFYVPLVQDHELPLVSIVVPFLVNLTNFMVRIL